MRHIRNNRRKYVLLLVSVGILAALLVLARTRSFRVAYHKRQMEIAYDATFGGAAASKQHQSENTMGELLYDRYTYHRQRLVELGAVRELRYKLEHILVPSDESRHFIKQRFLPKRPHCIDFTSPHPYKPQPMELTIWCFPEHARDGMHSYRCMTCRATERAS